MMQPTDPLGRLVDVRLGDAGDLRLRRNAPGMLRLIVDDDHVACACHLAQHLAHSRLTRACLRRAAHRAWPPDRPVVDIMQHHRPVDKRRPRQAALKPSSTGTSGLNTRLREHPCAVSAPNRRLSRDLVFVRPTCIRLGALTARKTWPLSPRIAAQPRPAVTYAAWTGVRVPIWSVASKTPGPKSQRSTPHVRPLFGGRRLRSRRRLIRSRRPVSRRWKCAHGSCWNPIGNRMRIELSPS